MGKVKPTSRLTGFHRRSPERRRGRLVEARPLDATTLVVHLHVDTRDARGGRRR